MRITLKQLILGGILLAGSVASPALAVDYHVGSLGPNDSYGSGGVIGNAANPSDRYFFSLVGAENLGGALTEVPPIVFSGGLIFGLSDVRSDFYSGTLGSSTFLGTVDEGQTLTFKGLTNGDYYVVISGTAINPLLGGTYALGLLATNAAPAPGPAGILVVGAAGAAMMLRRRKQARARMAIA